MRSERRYTIGVGTTNAATAIRPVSTIPLKTCHRFMVSTIQVETYRSEMLRLFGGFMLRCGLVGFIGSTIHVSPQCSHS